MDTSGVAVQIPRHVTKEFIDNSLDVKRAPAFRKKVFTHAVRMAGPFTVETREGTLECPDGWLAIDAHGWPYPIAAEEFAAIYEPADIGSRQYLEAVQGGA